MTSLARHVAVTFRELQAASRHNEADQDRLRAFVIWDRVEQQIEHARKMQKFGPEWHQVERKSSKGSQG